MHISVSFRNFIPIRIINRSSWESKKKSRSLRPKSINNIKVGAWSMRNENQWKLIFVHLMTSCDTIWEMSTSVVDLWTNIRFYFDSPIFCNVRFLSIEQKLSYMNYIIYHLLYPTSYRCIQHRAVRFKKQYRDEFEKNDWFESCRRDFALFPSIFDVWSNNSNFAIVINFTTYNLFRSCRIHDLIN